MGELFERTVERYDALIDWPARLAFERPLFERVFAQIGARRVLDAACGTGRHAARFHSWGLIVEGADASAAMIEHCQREYGQPAGLIWVVRPFEQRALAEGVPDEERFDAAVCIGNSLSLAADMGQVERSLGAMLSALRPGGVLVVQVLNLWRLASGPIVWQKSVRARLGGSEGIIVKGVHRCGDEGFVDVVELTLAGDKVERAAESTRLLGLRAEALEAAARRGGAGRVSFLGSYRGEPYEASSSTDVLMLAYRE